MIHQSVSGKNWILGKYDENIVKKITQDFGISEIVSRLLAIRKIPIDQCEAFLNPKIKNTMPNPFELKSMEDGTNLLIKHIKEKNKICIFGDYDVDGASSSAILSKYLTLLKSDNFIFIPDRLKDGYGPTKATIANIIEQGAKLIIAVDCGTTSFEAIEFAKQHNRDVIVIDHHQSVEKLPPADAIINPNRFDENSDLKFLCAAGVSFLFISALSNKLRKENFFINNDIVEPDLLSFLDLVTFGTVCDVVPLFGLNRSFVFQGLKVIANRNNLGIKTLADLTNLNSKIDTYHIGYILGPKINAGGRIGKSDYGVNLFLTQDPEQAFKISSELSKLNEKRKTIENLILEEAINAAKLKDNLPITVVQSQKWHEGIIGIIASRIKEHFNKPAFIINIQGDEAKGSARSIAGFDIGAAIIKIKQKGIIAKGGGHKMAAGFSMKKDKIDDFENEIIKIFNQSGCQSSKEKDLYIDTVISASALNEDFFDQINQLAPFGSGNKEPKFIIKNIQVTKSMLLKNLHVKAFCKTENNQNLNVISFNSSENIIGTYLLNPKNKMFDFAGRLSLNEWNGKKEVQFILDDLALATN